MSYTTNPNGGQLLSQVKDPSGRVKKFAYDLENLENTITDFDGEKMVYKFGSAKLLTKVTNSDGYSVQYQYFSGKAKRVRTITEYGGTTAGNRLTLTYGYNSTKFTDRKGRCEIFRFNNSGNLLHIHDGFGHAAGARYNTDGNHRNRLENETKLQDSIVQLLKDPIIQDTESSPWASSVSSDAQATASINTVSSHVKVGTRSLKLDSTALTGYAMWSQSVTVLKGNTYTFSMYVKTVITEADGKCLIRVQFKDKDQKTVRYDSEGITKSTSGFVKLDVTFTVPSDAASDSVTVYMILSQVKGQMYGDMAQLEAGTTANRCNLVDNGDFHLGSASGFSKTGHAEDGLAKIGESVKKPYYTAMMVRDDGTVLRSRPAAAGTAVVTVSAGTHLASVSYVTGSDGKTWYRVRTAAGKWGYVPTANVVPFVAGGNGDTAAYVAYNNTILRTGASDTSTPKQEGIAKQTPVVLKSSQTDGNGKVWYHVGMLIDKMILRGYLSADSLVRLCSNDARGEMAAQSPMYLSPSSSGSTSGTLAKGSEVRIRGVMTKSSGEVWYAILPDGSKDFCYLPKEKVTLTTAPSTGKTVTAVVSEGIGGLDGNIYHFNGLPTVDKKLTKTLNISGKKGDAYMVNAWGRGTSLPESEDDKARRFGVEVVFKGTTDDVHYTNFSPDILDWQFLSDVYVAKQAYTSITVSYTYCHNANMAFFDGLSLFREEYGRSYTYDNENNLISAVDAQKKARTFEYNNKNQLIGVVDARGNSFEYERDSKNNVTKGTSAQGVVYRLKYDSKGNVTKSGCVDPKETETGLWTSRTLTTDKNHVAKVTDPGGVSVQYGWDTAKDLLASVTDGRKGKLSYAYDTMGRLTSVSQPVTSDGVSQTVKNTYAYSKDRLSSITHNGFQYGFSYDAFGNLKEAKAAGTKIVSYEYAANNGNLTKVVYGNGDYIRYVYDDMDRVTRSYYYSKAKGAEEAMDQYEYDKQGNISKVICHTAGKTYRLYYDLLNRLVRVTDESGNAFEYTYDAENNMTRLRHIVGTNAVSATYAYDKDSRETKATIYRDRSRTTEYDIYGRAVKQTWDSDTPTVTTYGFNERGLVDSLRTGASASAYTYDANGNITQVRNSQDGGTAQTEAYQYDELNQLIREDSQSQGKTFAYSYDAGGNLVSVKQYAYTTAATLPATPTKTETGIYDTVWKDKLLEWDGVAMTYDAIGNMFTKGSATYTWTRGRKLASVNNGKSIQYSYNHNGMRTKKVVDGDVTELRYAGELLVSQTSPAGRQWFYYDSTGNLIAMSESGKDYFYVRNAQNDITGLVDESGTLVVQYSYDSWGKLLSITGTQKNGVGKRNPFRYRGYYYDDETGMYYLQNRYYDPGIRRFICADDMSVLYGNLDTLWDKNLYAYCDVNPVIRLDRDGDAWKLVAALVGGAVNVAASYIAAKVTGQDYSFKDGAAAFLGGVVNTIGFGKYKQIGKVINGVASGFYAGWKTYNETGNPWASLGVAVVSGVTAGLSISNLADLKAEGANIAVNAAADLTFGIGYASMAGAASNSASVLAAPAPVQNSRKETPVVKPSWIRKSIRPGNYAVVM